MQQVKLLWTICEYISETDRCHVDMVGIRDGGDYAEEEFARPARLLHPTEAGQDCGTGGLTVHMSYECGQKGYQELGGV